MNEMTAEKPVLALADYAAQVGKSLRTVQRWLADDLLPAYQDDEGRWWVPADARPEPGRRRTSSQPVAASQSQPPAVAAGPLLGVSGTLEDAAAALGVSPRGLKKLYADMRESPGLPMYIGRYGPHGATRVVVPPR